MSPNFVSFAQINNVSLPDAGAMPHSGQSTSAQAAYTAIEQCLETFLQLLKGAKVEYEAAPWAFELYETMDQHRTIATNAEEFFIRGSYHPDGATDDYPCSDVLNGYSAEFKKLCRNLYDLKNVMILGNRGRSIEPERTSQCFNLADFLILPAKGDPFSVFRFLTYLKERIQNPDPAQKHQILVIENRQNYYNPLFKKMFGNPSGTQPYNAWFELRLQALLDQACVTVKFSVSQLDSLRLCAAEKYKLVKKVPSFNKTEHIRSYPDVPVTTYLAMTSSPKKLKEYRLLYPHLKVISLAEITGTFPEAPEKHYTYPGNAVGVKDPQKKYRQGTYHPGIPDIAPAGGQCDR